MARIRSVKPDYFTSGKQLSLSADAALLNISLWTQADDAGRLKDDELEIAARCPRFLRNVVPVSDLLNALETSGFIHRYEIAGKKYIQIHDWLRHQKISHPTASTIPPLPEHSGNIQSPPDDSGGIGKERKGKDWRGEEGSEEGGRGPALSGGPPLPFAEKKRKALENLNNYLHTQERKTP